MSASSEPAHKSLVYMPGLALDEAEFTEACSLKNLRHYIAMPALVHADETVVPSEDVRKGYIDIILHRELQAVVLM